MFFKSNDLKSLSFWEGYKSAGSLRCNLRCSPTDRKMHGQAKVKSTEIEKEKKRKQRETKVKAYRDGMEQFYCKRKNKEYDEEALTIISDLLSANPDIYTLWNFRKEIILNLKESKSVEENGSLLSSELKLTEVCLRCNPKSYGAWYHRQWLMDNMPDPDLKRELELCTKYLKLDERNFHCWDYRRFVASGLGVSPADELAYSTTRIEDNFSNYSSWHYRSKLLPLVHPDPAKLRPINEKTHLQELEMVLNAAFTDPSDQSAWFYQRWLLGCQTKSSPYLVQALMASEGTNIYFAFDRSVSPVDYTLLEPSCLKDEKFTTINGQPMSTVLTMQVESASNCTKIVLQDGHGNVDEFVLEGSCGYRFVRRRPKFNREFSPTLINVLEDQLKLCRQLLALEPDSKWTLLTVALLMQAIDRNKLKDEIMDNLSMLLKVDSLRSAYYLDLKSRFLIENALDEAGDSLDEFSLPDYGLTWLYHAQHLMLMTKVDLSGNNLQRSLAQLYPLQKCQVLILDYNKLTSLIGFPRLASLKTLSLKYNKIDSHDKIAPHLKCCGKLESLDIRGNPISENYKEIEHFTEIIKINFLQSLN